MLVDSNKYASNCHSFSDGAWPKLFYHAACLTFPQQSNLALLHTLKLDRRNRTALAIPVGRVALPNRIALAPEVRSKDLVNERLFGFSFHMNEQSHHRAESLRPSSRAGRPPISFFSHSWPRL